MKLNSTYKVRIGKDVGVPLEPTVRMYRSAVSYFVDVVAKEWDSVFASCGNGKDAVRNAERLCIATTMNTTPVYNFSESFYKFPSYLRRAAIAEAYGMVSSYRSNLKRWVSADPKTRGKRPSLPSVGESCPAMYKGNCFIRTGTYTARIKAFIRNTWDWLDVRLRKTDVDYILRHCTSWKECSPTLRRRGKNWSLDFSFEKSVKLNDVNIKERRILAVDLGINNAATCCVMEHDGTVLARRFLSLRRENDCLDHSLELIKRAQRSGAKHMPNLWAKANGINRRIAEETARFIEEMSVLYDCDVVVMEHLDTGGKKKGGKKQRLHLWKVRHVQKLVSNKCHADGNRMATVCARNTSRLAYDGSGFVKRGRESDRTNGSYSVCEFANGKVYNCDLNAAYNIGARYFIREILGEMPERARSEVEAQVPRLLLRSTCTLSDLKGLRAAMDRLDDPSSERVMSGKTRDSRAPQGQPLSAAEREARDFSRARLHFRLNIIVDSYIII